MENNTKRELTAEEISEIKISDEALAVIAAIAATEVPGVDSMVGGITSELIDKLGVKNLSKGVRITVEDGRVFVELSLNIKSDVDIPELSRKVQHKVKSELENMTGLLVPYVKIRIAGITAQ